MKRYEGMFLFDTAAVHDWAGIEQEVRRLCGRISAELLVCIKFDERKLAYEVKRRKRGTYVLTYFDAPPERIVDMQRDAELSESVLRLLVLQGDQVPAERINELKAWPAETPLQPQTSERRHDEHGFRGGPSYPRPERAPRPHEPSAELAGVGAEMGPVASEVRGMPPGPVLDADVAPDTDLPPI